MSGHSKWAQIKHKKGASDAKRGRVFSKLAAQITLAAKQNGPNPDTNPSLRSAIDKARAENMPQDNIARAINKGAGIGTQENLEEFVYEAYGPGGVAILIEGITDNNNRTSNEIKKTLNLYNSKWAEPGSVKWAFDKTNSGWEAKQYSLIELSNSDKQALDTLLEQLDEHEDVQAVYTNLKKA